MVTKEQHALKTHMYAEFESPAHAEFMPTGTASVYVNRVEVEHRDPKKVFNILAENSVSSFPSMTSALRFRFYDVVESKEGANTCGRSDNYSGWFYLGGREMSLEQVKDDMSYRKILIMIMEQRGNDRVVFTKNGGAYPLEREDVVLGDPLESLARK